jgi:hypothetical protein
VRTAVQGKRGVETVLSSLSIFNSMCELLMTFENTLSASGQAIINPSSLPTVPLNRVRVWTAVQGKKGLTTVLPSLLILISSVDYSDMAFENTLSVSGQACINRSSLPTVPLNRARVRTAVQ